MLLVIPVSVLSINPVTFECLNTPSNWLKLFVLYVVNVLVILVVNDVEVSVVLLESNLNATFKIIFVVCVSTTTGDIDATVKGVNAVINEDFSVSVKLLPVVDCMAIKTLPYSAVLTTPRLVS